MTCYICEQAPQNGTMHYAVNQAVGVCQHCGIGICTQHSQKAQKLGSPLLCAECAALPTATLQAGRPRSCIPDPVQDA